MYFNASDSYRSAFELAYFIIPDKEIAEIIARDALLKLEVAANNQFKRYYYTPTGRGGRNGSTRTRVNLEEAQLLQRLVYISATTHEKEQEADRHGARLSREDMIVRFVKYLVQTTLKRNSFYVSLGVMRLLHKYKTKETMDLYGVLVQDPDRVPDDHYFRSRKKTLLEEIRGRFGDLLKTVRGQRGEVRFEEDTRPSAIEAARKSLARFTPWQTDCCLEAEHDPREHGLEAFAYHGDDPDGEHAIELRRIHTVLHPKCFDALTQTLSLSAPESNLAVPAFDLASIISGNSDRFDPPGLSKKDREKATSFLEHARGGRKKSPASALVLRVDGVDYGMLDPLSGEGVSIQLTEAAELIEVVGPDELLMATWVLDGSLFPDRDEVCEQKIRLEGGQELSFRLAGQPGLGTEEQRFALQVDYRETHPFRVTSLAMRRAGRYLLSHQRTAMPVLIGALAVLLLVFTFTTDPDSGSAPLLQEVHESLDETMTRDLMGGIEGLPIDRVQTIWVDDLGSAGFNTELRADLITSISATGSYRLAEERERADAVIKNLAPFMPSLDDPRDLVLALVNAEGEPLWAAHHRRAGDEQSRDLAAAVVRAIEDARESH